MRANITTTGELPVSEQIFDGLKTALYDAVQNKLGYPVEIVLTCITKEASRSRQRQRYYPLVTGHLFNSAYPKSA